MKTINFVCTGNICRSAMAHAYLQKKINDLNMQDDIIVSSCGIRAYTGDKITKFAEDAISKYGVDAKNHRATNIYDSGILNSDLVLCMTKSHKRSVIEIYPKLIGKVFTLKEYVGLKNDYLDIDDPWGYGMSVYNTCAEEIVKCIDKLVKML